MKLNERDRQILQIAVPAIVTNITVPLLGLVDTAIVGHMGSAVYIGAIAVGSMIFNLVYWIFGFLRMGTSGMTAQARGRRDFREASALLVRSLTIALLTAAMLLLLQWPLRELMLFLLHPSAEVMPLARQYFNIVIWGAPAMLSLYGLSGWYVGMQNTRIPMLISIMQNVVNIVASLCLVYGIGLKIEGVAFGTLIAQYAGVGMGVALLWRYYGRVLRSHLARSASRMKIAANMADYTTFLRVNRDIFLRTVFLVAVNLYFTAMGARQGDIVLAVNTLLMQLYLLFSYMLDGFAYAGEALGGRYWGARHYPLFRATVRRLFLWGIVMVALFTAAYSVAGMPFLQLLTNEAAVLSAARSYLFWACLIPAAGVAAFIFDGIFIGITATRGMLLSSLIATAVFFTGCALLMPAWSNHGLWLSMLLYLATRGVVQGCLFHRRYSLPAFAAENGKTR